MTVKFISKDKTKDDKYRLLNRIFSVIFKEDQLNYFKRRLGIDSEDRPVSVFKHGKRSCFNTTLLSQKDDKIHRVKRHYVQSEKTT